MTEYLNLQGVFHVSCAAISFKERQIFVGRTESRHQEPTAPIVHDRGIRSAAEAFGRQGVKTIPDRRPNDILKEYVRRANAINCSNRGDCSGYKFS